jgi:type IV pilus assembly protein PilO
MNLKSEQLRANLEKFAKLPKAYRLAVFAAIAALLVGTYVYLLFLPARADLERQQAKQFELQRKLNEVSSVAANLEKFQEEIDALEMRLKVALRQLPDSKELPVLLTDVTSLGKNAGLEFRAFRPQAEVMRDFYAEVPIEIEFTGQYHDIATFFDRVSKLPRIVNVAELEMQIEHETPSETFLVVTGSATTFRFVEQKPEPEDSGKGKRKGRGHKKRKKGKSGHGEGGAA